MSSTESGKLSNRDFGNLFNRRLHYTLIPTPNRNVVEEYKLQYDSLCGGSYGTIIIDKKGFMRFKSNDDRATRTSPSRIIKELQGI